MQHLSITPDLVLELHARSQECSDPARVGIVLTSDGWTVAEWATERPPHPVAIPAAEVTRPDWPMDYELATVLCTRSQEETSYQVVDEYGAVRAPDPDGEPVIVVCDRVDPRDPHCEEWAGAWWYDPTRAYDVLNPPTRAVDAPVRDHLLVTASGRYVVSRHNRLHADGHVPHVLHYEITPARAAEMIYDAGDDQDVRHHADHRPGGVPIVVNTARLARRLAAAAFEPTEPAATSADASAEIVRSSAVLSDLLRTRVLPYLRYLRGAEAAELVLMLGSQDAAAKQVGVSQPTLHALLKAYDPDNHTRLPGMGAADDVVSDGPSLLALVEDSPR